MTLTAPRPDTDLEPRALTGSDLTMSYGRTDVVRGATLELTPGTITALIGPNGSGKSTLLRGLTALQRPTSGTVRFGDGVDAATLDGKQLARRVAMLVQSRPTPAGVSVREIVEYGRYPHRARFARMSPADHDAVNAALAATGIAALTERSVTELSGGQLQRVWLAACLAQATGTVLLDEPTTYLDLRYQRDILVCVQQMAARGVAVGIVLHDLDQAAEIADRVALLVDGTVVADDTPHEVMTSERLTRAYGVDIDVTMHGDTLSVRTRRLPRLPRD